MPLAGKLTCHDPAQNLRQTVIVLCVFIQFALDKDVEAPLGHCPLPKAR